MASSDPVDIVMVGVHARAAAEAACAVADLTVRAIDEDHASAEALGQAMAVVVDDSRDRAMCTAAWVRERIGSGAALVIAVDPEDRAMRAEAERAGADVVERPLTPAVVRARFGALAAAQRQIRALQQRTGELETHVADRTVALEAWAERLGLAADSANVGVYDIDVDRGERHFSAKLRELCGFGVEGAVSDADLDAATHPEDRAERGSIAAKAAASPAGEFEVEYRIIGAGGRVLWILDRGRAFFADRGGQRRMVRILGSLLDITERRRAQEVRETLAAIVECSQDAIISKTLDGTVTSWNAGATGLFGYTAQEMIGRPITVLIPAELQWQEQDILGRLRRGERLHSFETVRRAKDGRMIDVSVTISPIRDSRGRIIGASKVSRDITERKKVDAILARDHATLERMVAERTTELEQTSEQLRFADRMATIGTLSAGLGHDMGNLLLPVRIRLDAMLSSPRAESIRGDLSAIRDATQYLQRLARSLRLLAIDPAEEPFADACTDLHAWWHEVEGMMRNALPRSVTLASQVPGDLPAIRIGETALTQAVFNLIQNAGHAAEQSGGRVELHAGLLDPEHVFVRIADNGIGMSDEIRRRCQEPFFTTRTRGLGTGLGLTLVAGLVRRAGGSLDVQSKPDQGTTMTLILPAARAARPQDGRPPSTIARIDVADRRLRAHIVTVLTSRGIDARTDLHRDHANLWVFDDAAGATEDDIGRFLDNPERRTIELRRGAAPDLARRMRIDPALKPTAIRSRLVELLLTENLQGAGS